MLVSVIVPAYKQEKTIVQDIKNINDAMSKTRFDYEIIVVVDGFVDKTYELAKTLESPIIKVYGNERNRGKGYTVKYGMARSKGELVAFIDAGMEINPNGISMILEHMIWYNADIIVGSKRHPASNVNYPFARKVFSNFYYILVRILFRIKVRDTQVGLKVYKRNVLEAVLPRLVVKRFAFDIELLAVAKYLGYRRIYEAPVTLNLVSGSMKIIDEKFFRFVKAFLIDTIAVFYRMYFLKYYHDDSKRSWVYDKELDMKINTGQMDK
jgi:glycosyltransferase involved in cell wall biosynthesis